VVIVGFDAGPVVHRHRESSPGDCNRWIGDSKHNSLAEAFAERALTGNAMPLSRDPGAAGSEVRAPSQRDRAGIGQPVLAEVEHAEVATQGESARSRTEEA